MLSGVSNQYSYLDRTVLGWLVAQHPRNCNVGEKLLALTKLARNCNLGEKLYMVCGTVLGYIDVD